MSMPRGIVGIVFQVEERLLSGRQQVLTYLDEWLDNYQHLCAYWKAVSLFQKQAEDSTKGTVIPEGVCVESVPKEHLNTLPLQPWW